MSRCIICVATFMNCVHASSKWLTIQVFGGGLVAGGAACINILSFMNRLKWNACKCISVLEFWNICQLIKPVYIMQISKWASVHNCAWSQYGWKIWWAAFSDQTALLVVHWYNYFWHLYQSTVTLQILALSYLWL